MSNHTINSIEPTESWVTKVFNYRTFLLLIITGAMINNLDHSAHLYMKISSSVSLYHAYSVVIIFDLIVIALIWIGDAKALIFAISIFMINQLAWDGTIVFYELFFRFSNPEKQIDNYTKSYLDLITKATTMLIYGGTFVFTVHHFSKLFKSQIMKRSRFNGLLNNLRHQINEQVITVSNCQQLLEETNRAYTELESQHHELVEKLSTRDHEFSIKEQLIVELRSESEELRVFKEKTEKDLVCVCGKKFDSISSKLGHQRKCEIYKSANRVKVLQ